MRKRKRILALLMTLIMSSSMLQGTLSYAEDTTYLTYYSNVGFTTPGSLSTMGTSYNFRQDGVVTYNATGLTLTPAGAAYAGSAFLNKKIKQSDGFSSYFNFTLKYPRSAYGLDAGADGLVFIVAKNTNSLGGIGEGIGYTGINNSIGIEFDSFPNANDISNSHIGINLNGQLTSDKNKPGYEDNVADLGANYFNEDGPFHVWIDYESNSQLLSVYISKTTTRPASPTLTKTIDLSQYCGDEYYVGFTAATGSCYEAHKIGKWYFKNAYVPGGLSATSTSYDTDTEAPTAPTLTELNKIVTLSDSTDDKSGVDHYEYQLNSTSGIWHRGTSVDITGYTSATVYARAVDGVGNISNIQSHNYHLDPPNKPTDVFAVVSDEKATVSFTPPTYDGGSVITGYTVTSSPGGISVSGTESPILVTGLTNGTLYDFTVVANNVVGSSEPSSASNQVIPYRTEASLEATAHTLTPKVGEETPVTLTVRNSLGDVDASIDGMQTVTITGVEVAPNGSYGRLNETALIASSSGLGQGVVMNFTSGTALVNLALNKAEAQNIMFSLETPARPVSNVLLMTPEHSSPVALSVLQDILAPSGNGQNFLRQPVVALVDTFGNLCSHSSETAVTVSKEDSGAWTLTGTLVKTASGGAVSFTDLGALNSGTVNLAQLKFTAQDLATVKSSPVTLPGATSSGGASKGGTAVIGGGAVSATKEDAVIVIVNGKQQNAGIESRTTESGKSVVTVDVNKQVIESKIDEAVKNNTAGSGNVIQVPVADTQSEVVKVALTGDIIKKLEMNTFDVSVKRNDIEYIIPANEFGIGKIAEHLGVLEKELKDIKVEIQITKLEDGLVNKYNESAKNSGATLMYRPTQFEVIARTQKEDGTADKVYIEKFKHYVERIIALPAGVDPSKVTTGIVFNADGSYSHVPTEVFVKEGQYYARLNSLTNSDYSIIWHPTTVKSVASHWSKNAVNDMASRLVVFNSESFAPDKAITRADFAEYMVRALGLYRVGSSHDNHFKDVSEKNERGLAIAIASEYGLVSGYADGSFKPDALITREEAMTMYQKAMTLTSLTGKDLNRYIAYKDFSKVSTWATPYVKDVVAAKVFNGNTANTLSPQTNLTYAEAAQAIKNLLVASGLINQ